ncbi:MAG: S9 family peptidase [Candidatus Rifleibacteriota bacterium]
MKDNRIPLTPGSWPSALTPEKMVEKANRPVEILQLKEKLFILEARPSEKGRNTLVCLDNDVTEEVLPSRFNIRSRVHEYGGLCIASDQSNYFYFTEFSDQQIYRLSLDGTVTKLTNEPSYRFADFNIDPKRNLLFAVMEDHSKSDLNPENSIVKINLENGKVSKIIAGNDFYSSPRISPDGQELAYITWNHPQMPWDGTELHTALVADEGNIKSSKKISGCSNESVCRPQWHNKSLFYISDKNGWWNIFKYENEKSSLVFNKDADFSGPPWSFAKEPYQILDDDRIFVTWTEDACWHAGIINMQSEALENLNFPYQLYSSITLNKDHIYFIGAGYKTRAEVVQFDYNSSNLQVLFGSSEIPVAKSFISKPESIYFEVAKNQKAHAFYYPPANPDYKIPENEKPPLLVCSHGGPTGCSNPTLRLDIQFWTTRGFAVLDVNYSGSTGFGRAYRDRLKGSWGIIDVRDCEKGALYLKNEGLVDSNKIAIRGGSAGGYTTLCALTFTDTFKAGASHFGLSDLEILAKETHKFESRYMDNLIGPYPEKAEIYKNRSPINFPEKLSCPVIFFQGLDDKVVPPNQAEELYKILKKKKIPTCYVTYEGEGHGFRQAENIKHSLKSELYFYCRIFKLKYPDNSKPVEIDNLKN